MLCRSPGQYDTSSVAIEVADNLQSAARMALYVVVRPGLGTGTAESAQSACQPAVVPQPDSCETLFWALDGRDLVVLGRRWHVEVFSVVELAGRRYIQLSLAGLTDYMLTLRLTPATPVRHLIPAVLTWLTHPTASGEVIDVA